MIIYGTRGKEVVEHYGDLDCPVCRKQTPCAHKAIKRYFTLYFIPLFPVGTVSTWVECNQCGGQFKSDAVTATRHGSAPPPGGAGIPGLAAAPVPHVDSNANLALGLGIASLVLLPCCGVLSVPLGLVAAGVGGWSLKRQGEDPLLQGRGQAIAGIAFGLFAGLGAAALMALGTAGQMMNR